MENKFVNNNFTKNFTLLLYVKKIFMVVKIIGFLILVWKNLEILINRLSVKKLKNIMKISKLSAFPLK